MSETKIDKLPQFILKLRGFIIVITKSLSIHTTVTTANTLYKNLYEVNTSKLTDKNM